MVYQIPVWKLEKFYVVAHRSKKHVLFGSETQKCHFGMEHPHLHTKLSLYYSRKVQRSQIFKQIWIILISSKVIKFYWFGGDPPWGLGGVGGSGFGYGVSYASTHIHACAHTCTCMHVKHDNFMQMATPIGKSLGKSYDVICTYMSVWDTFPHIHIHTHPYPPTPNQGDPLKSVKM